MISVAVEVEGVSVHLFYCCFLVPGTRQESRAHSPFPDRGYSSME